MKYTSPIVARKSTKVDETKTARFLFDGMIIDGDDGGDGDDDDVCC